MGILKRFSFIIKQGKIIYVGIVIVINEKTNSENSEVPGAWTPEYEADILATRLSIFLWSNCIR